MTNAKNQANNASETDSRLPSGEWTGFFQQPGLRGGRGWMELQLSFKAGLIRGEGRDLVGQFSMFGRYDLKSEQVQVHKRYLGQHDVFYRGYAEQGRGIWGVWTIGRARTRGGFHLWPKGMADPTGAALRAAVPLPMAVQPSFVVAAHEREI